MADTHTGDWTRDDDGRSNSSQAFLDLVDVITDKHLHVGAAADLIDRRWAEQKARGILASLAHRHGLRPAEVPPVDWANIRQGVLDLIRAQSTPVVSFEGLADVIVVYVQAQLHPMPRGDDPAA
jgi:hypothetical protein